MTKRKSATRRNPYAFKSQKMERQFKELQRRFNITRAEFAEYYRDVRRANKKAQNMKRYKGALYVPKYSLEVSNIRTRKDFAMRRKSLQNVLSKSFRNIKNAELRTRLYANLYYAYGADAQPVINEFMAMSDAEIQDFFDTNDDLEMAFYDSDQSGVSMYLDTIGMTVQKWHERANK